jgi:hypothetical protein
MANHQIDSFNRQGAVMARKARMYIPGVPCHIIQRGNNRDAIFITDQDCQYASDLFSRSIFSGGV